MHDCGHIGFIHEMFLLLGACFFSIERLYRLRRWLLAQLLLPWMSHWHSSVGHAHCICGNHSATQSGTAFSVCFCNSRCSWDWTFVHLICLCTCFFLSTLVGPVPCGSWFFIDSMVIHRNILNSTKEWINMNHAVILNTGWCVSAKVWLVNVYISI